MADGDLQVLDGTQLNAADLSLPEFSDAGEIAGVRVLEIAGSRVSECLRGLSLPENLKSSALQRLNIDIADFVGQQLDKEKAQSFLRSYITAITDELRDDPLVVSVLDGKTIRLFLEDEDDFAMLAENLFTELDEEDDGKLSKSEIRTALVHMGVEMGVPPLADLPVINDILKKHGAEGEGKLGQAQFAQLLQLVLQDLADALALKAVTVMQNVKIINGSKLKKLFANENQLNDVIEKIYQQKHDHEKGQSRTESIMSYLSMNGEELGLPRFEANEAVILLYDTIFSEVSKEKTATELDKDGFGTLVKQILQKFAEQLQANPIFLDANN